MGTKNYSETDRFSSGVLTLDPTLLCVPAGASTGTLNVTSLTINGGPNQEARVVIGNDASAFSVGINTLTGNFAVRNGDQEVFTITKTGDVEIKGLIKATDVKIGGVMKFRGENQWLLAVAEDFGQVS